MKKVTVAALPMDVRRIWRTALAALACLSPLLVVARQVLELQGVNFELALTSNKYAAIAFYDGSEAGQILKQEWLKAAATLGTDGEEDLYEEAEMAMINGADPEIQELVDAYAIVVPSIKVFRRGIMSDYRGPLEAAGMAQFLPADSRPSVKVVASLAEMKQALKKDAKNVVVLGFFDQKDVAVEDSGDTYSIEPWGQFQAAADALRGHAVFYSLTSEDVFESFQVKASELPAVYMVTEDGLGLMPYSGEILEMNLSEWVLRHSSPSMGELTLAQSTGEVFATQFFSARKLKFILFLRSADAVGGPGSLLEHWRSLAETFKGSALFAYMVNAGVPDVVEYFSVDVAADLPLVVAHDPSRDFKYKSERLDAAAAAAALARAATAASSSSGSGSGSRSSGSRGSSSRSNGGGKDAAAAASEKSGAAQALEDFVAGVLTGTVKKLVKSEPVPVPGKNPKPVVQAVGSNVAQVVGQADKDVLLEVYAPWCAQCKRLRATLDILGRAVQAESRIVVAKIDGTANDLPPSWGVKTYPVLLWFPAKDKPYRDPAVPVPRPYWDAGHSLHELVSFVQRSSSFDVRTLRIATSEQLGSLLGDEETLRLQYEQEDRWARRNEGRDVLSHPLLDWAAGEIVFDGKRWHLAAAAALALVTLVSLVMAASRPVARTATQKKKVP